MVKQVIVVRKDLPWTKGKMCAQVGHAAMAFIVGTYDGTKHLSITLTKEEQQWLTEDSQTKIVLGIDSLDELRELIKVAHGKGLTVRQIIDAGKTVFKEPTLTCIAIGPNQAEEIDSVTRHLKLM